MSIDNLACYHCGQIGHLRQNCPSRAPLPVSAPTPDAPARSYIRKDTIECDICHSDWVAVFDDPQQFLSTLTCPWCRIYERRDGAVYRRAEPLP